MHQSPSRTLLEHWNEIRVGQEFALREDIRPQKLGKALPLILVIVRDGTDFRFRLAGTSICAFFGRELRDEAFSAFWQDESAGLANAAALQALEQRSPICFHLAMETHGSSVAASLLLLPLATNQGLPDRLIGALELNALAEQRILNEGLTGIRLIMATKNLLPSTCRMSSTV